MIILRFNSIFYFLYNSNENYSSHEIGTAHLLEKRRINLLYLVNS